MPITAPRNHDPAGAIPCHHQTRMIPPPEANKNMAKVEITIKFTKHRACVRCGTTAALDVSVYGGGYEAGQPHAG
jgi:hypothetical protein